METNQSSHIQPIYAKEMNNPTVETKDSFSTLLELAANNDVEGFQQAIQHAASSINEVGLWYGRKKGSKQMVLEHRTPLMVAAIYGSIDVLKLILDQSEADVNLSCGPDKSTALHCAASCGSINAVDVVKMLLIAGADPNSVDFSGHRPADVIVVPPKLSSMKVSLEALLMNNASNGSIDERKLRISTSNSDSNSPMFSSPNGSPSSPLDPVSSPLSSKFNDISTTSISEKKEYPIDLSLPDIKNSIYSTDEFRMFSFKVRPCSRAYSHDWTECPFVHPGENARRRDPRKYHYSCVPCPDFRKGACRRGDMCEYAHGVFECWLHPAQYRTRLCKDGTSCARRVCFFAHRHEELRPLYVSTGSAVPSSPRSAAANAMDMAAALNLFSGSPSANGIPNSMGWPQPNVPTLHLPSSNFQSSRLRSSLNARDIPPEDFDFLLSDLDAHQQLLNDLACYSQPRSSSPSLNHSSRSKILAPSNLDELFSSEISLSPRYSDQSAASLALSPSHKSALLSQFQQQQSMLSPINTSVFSPGRMSPRTVEPISPMGSRISTLAQREKQHQQLRSLSSRDLGSPANPWSNLGSPIGKADWSVNGNELGLMQRSSSYDLTNNGEEPDLSWIQSLVKESPPDNIEKPSASVYGTASNGENYYSNSQTQSTDQSVLGDWLEHMQLEH